MNYYKARRALAKGLAQLIDDPVGFQEYKLQNLCKKNGIRLVNYRTAFCPLSCVVHPKFHNMMPIQAYINYPYMINPHVRKFSSVKKYKLESFDEKVKRDFRNTPSYVQDFVLDNSLGHIKHVYIRKYQLYFKRIKIGSVIVNACEWNKFQITSFDTYDLKRNSTRIAVHEKSKDTNRAIMEGTQRSIKYIDYMSPCLRHVTPLLPPEIELYKVIRRYQLMTGNREKYTSSKTTAEHFRYLYPPSTTLVTREEDDGTIKYNVPVTVSFMSNEDPEFVEYYKRLPRKMKEFEWAMRFS